MAEVDIRFEREGLDGIIPVGTYLSDAARRFGIDLGGNCGPGPDLHICEIEITKGGELLSPRTSIEEKFLAERSDGNIRLACQARVEKEGEIVVMTKEKEEPEKPASSDEDLDYREKFAKMPLEKKIADLVQLEAMAFGETVSYLINSPFALGDKLIGVMSEFGMKLDRSEKEARRPEEHKTREEDKTKEENDEKETKAKEKND